MDKPALGCYPLVVIALVFEMVKPLPIDGVIKLRQMLGRGRLFKLLNFI